MKTSPLIPMRLISTLLLVAGSAWPMHAAEPNTLTSTEKAEGWRLLFDGHTTQGWRSFKLDSFPARGWVVEEGWLKKVGKVRGGDIISQEQFDDFELQWEWKISTNGNNGIKYFITEQRSGPIGHEYQMMDDLKGRRDKHSTASFYEVLAARADAPLKPAGEINQSRVVVRGDQVEHWLNGAKVLEYTLGSAEVLAGVANSKFKNVEGFGTKIKGHILLTDHNDEAWFRTVKIKALSAPHESRP